jgi:nucleoside-diphosphate-sugar epimerase
VGRRGASHLVTGGTSAIGAAIALELLRCTSATIYCLVRGDSQAAASDRLLATLDATAEMYDFDAAAYDLRGRCVALAGDITTAGCGLADEALAEDISEIWHCAQSSRATEKRREEIELRNVEGIGNVLALARRLGVACVNHLSTAYVAGSQGGLASELPAPLNRPTNNVYEETKIRAEALVAQAADSVRILRPSVVVGHSRTRRYPSDCGIYGFLDRLQRFRQAVDEQLGDYFRYRSLSLLGDPQTTLNLIPVDIAAEAAVHLSVRGAPDGIYHLASLDPPTLAEVMSSLMGAVGMQPVRFVQDARQLNNIDVAFNGSVHFHHAAWLQSRDFDCANTTRFFPESRLHTALRGANLTQLAATYVEVDGDALTTQAVAQPERTM